MQAPEQPLYEKVKDYVLCQIRAGSWQPGHRIPSENELVLLLGISRMTANRALRELTAAGHLERRQGLGTFVASRPARSELLQIRDIADEIAARGHRHQAQVLLLERISSPADVQARLELAQPRPVFHSMIVHFEEGVAVQLEERFVNPALVPDYGQQDFTVVTPSDYLLRVTPVSEIEQEVRAEPAGAVVAGRLDIPTGAACLIVERRTWSGRIVATFSRFTYAGSRCALGSRYRPGGQGTAR